MKLKQELCWVLAVGLCTTHPPPRYIHTKEGQRERSPGPADTLERAPEVLHTTQRQRWREEERGGAGSLGAAWGGAGAQRPAACAGTEFNTWKTLTLVKIATAGLKIAAGEIHVR